jgi:hypothetical protein
MSVVLKGLTVALEPPLIFLCRQWTCKVLPFTAAAASGKYVAYTLLIRLVLAENRGEERGERRER